MSSQPLFWIFEKTGKLKEIVMKFLEREKLNERDLKTLKWYIIQWIDGLTPAPPDYKETIESMNQSQLQEYVPGKLLDYGIDPF